MRSKEESATPATLGWLRAIDDAVRAELAEVWVDVTNAGGAVGFLPPVTSADVTKSLTRIVEGVERGDDDLLVATLEGRIVGWVLLESDARAFAAHWRMVKRFQVHPRAQRLGLGGQMMSEVSHYAREKLGLEFLVLTVRDGTGAGALYERLGYVEIGRIAGAMRLGGGDVRDEIYMRLDLA